jgi:hypothetical protein
MHDTCHRCFSCRRKIFKISLEVAALGVVAPFMVALDGDVTILPSTMADELITEVNRCDAQWHARLRVSVNALSMAPAALPLDAGY